jgi:hypothetical protein
MPTEKEKAAALEAEIAELDRQDSQPATEKPLEAPATPAPAPEAPKEPEVPAEQQKPTEGQPKPTERPTFTMPVRKHTEQMETLKEKHAVELEEARKQAREEALAEARAAAPTGQMSESKIKQYAEKYETDEESVKDLLALIREENTTGAPKQTETPKQTAAPTPQGPSATEIAVAQKEVEVEFYRDVYPELLRQNAPPEHIEKVKNRISELAFTPEYNTILVKDIFAQKGSELGFVNRASAESSRGGSTAGVVDFSRVTNDEINAMTPAEAEKYFAWEASQGKKSRYKT